MSNKLAGIRIPVKNKPEKDFLAIYNVAKKDLEQPADVQTAIKCIYDYVANSPMYFKVEPVMHNSRLVFSITGLRSDHVMLVRVLGLAVGDCNCVLVHGPFQKVPRKQ